MSIPKHLNRYHEDEGLDQWKGDCPRAIVHASQQPLGADDIRAIDINFQVCLSDDNLGYEEIGLHSATARRNGWHYITYRNKFGIVRRRLMTKEELDRHINHWRLSGVKRWRRTARRGTSYESRVRIHTFYELVKFAKGNKITGRKPVTVCPELKSSMFAIKPVIAENMCAQVKALKTTVYPMTLVTMSYWGPKLRNAHNAGFETALLLHGEGLPLSYSVWKKYIDVLW